jgi:hypothetical protein
LLIFLLLSLHEIITKKNINVSTGFLNVFMLWIILCLLSYIHGIFNDFIFSFNLLNSMILTPIFCLFLSVNINNERLVFIHNSFITISIFLLLITFFYIGSKVNLYQMPNFLSGMSTFGGVKVGNEQLEFRLTNQPSLIFLLPYISTMFLFDNKSNKKLLFLILFFGLIVVILSGRRSLQILFFLGILINSILYVVKYGLNFSIILRGALYLLIFTILLSFVFEVVSFITGLKSPVETFINTIFLAFDPNERSSIIRDTQSVALKEYFSNSPLFGYGLNSHPEFIRSIDEKWSYEWVYLAFFAQNGIFIGLVLIISFAGIALKLLKAFKTNNQRDSIIFGAFLNGYICFIIAGASNPMIFFSWFWLLSFIVFNNHFKVIKFK